MHNAVLSDGAFMVIVIQHSGGYERVYASVLARQKWYTRLLRWDRISVFTSYLSRCSSHECTINISDRLSSGPCQSGNLCTI